MRPHLLIFTLVLLLIVGPTGFAQNSKENADFKLAINLFNDGLFDLAAEQLKQFIATYPTTPQGIDARFYLGLTQLKLKRFDDARLTFQTFALTYQDNPKAPEAWWNVGESYAAVKNYKEAALAYERVKVFHPKSKSAPDALLRAARNFNLAGERDNARRVLRTILQEYATSAAVLPARTLLGEMYFDEGNLDQAQSELKRVIEGDPSPDAKAQALLILGNIDQAMGKVDQAQSNYQEIIAKYKSSSAIQGAYVNLGRLLSSSGKNAEAVDNFKKALAEKTGLDSLLTREALISLGDAYVSLRQFNDAVGAYDKYVNSNPLDEQVPEVLWKEALASSKGGNFRRSNDECNLLLKSNAPDALKRRAQLKLGRNAEDQKNFITAVQYYEAFVDRHPDDAVTPAIVLHCGELAEKSLRDPRKGAATYGLLLSRYRHSPLVDDALAGAARCHEQLKEFDQALTSYREIADRFPASEFRQVSLERIRMIETFEAKDKDAGLEKLALLVGDVVGEKDKQGLSFRLGEIYYIDLKNYAAAAAQFTSAIAGGMDEARAAEAAWMRARSLEFLSWKDAKFRPQAVDAFRSFLQAHPADSRRDSALLSFFNLSATSPAGARRAFDTVTAISPSFTHRDAMLMTLGAMEEKADSLPEALATFSTIVGNFRSSPYAEEAADHRLDLLFRTGLADSALVEGTTFVATYPSGPFTANLLSRLASLCLKRGDARRALEFYQKLTSDFAYTSVASDSRRPLADTYLAAENFESAIALYSELLDQEANDPLDDSLADPAILLALGRSYNLAGKAGEAKKYLFQLLARERTGELAGAAYNTLGMIYRTEGEMDVATGYFKQAEQASPSSTASRDIANLFFENGEYPDAIRQYTLLLQASENDTDRQYYDARIIIARIRNGELATADKAVAAFSQKYKATDEDNAAFELEKGTLLFRKKDYAGALKILTRVTSKYEETSSGPPAMYWIGKSLEATGKAEDAVNQLDDLIKAYPQSPITARAYLALGNIYYNAEKWDESIRNYRKIVDDPKADPALLPFAMSNLIETYEIAGINDAALSLTRKYLELYPNNDDSFDKRIKIGILYGKLGYYDQSVLQLQSLLDEAGSDLEGEIRYYIAEANYNKGDYQQAILDFLKVPYLVTKKGKIDWTANSLYMSGQSYEKMGRYDQAITMYQQIIDRTGIDPTFKAAAGKEIDRVKLVLKKKPN